MQMECDIGWRTKQSCIEGSAIRRGRYNPGRDTTTRISDGYGFTRTPPTIPRFADVQALAAADMQAVNALIRARLASDVVLVNQIAEYIVGGGGKRLRPLLHLLAARAAGYRGHDQITLAAVIEFIHTATLLHDDVVDESDLRRGRKTANALWGNAASVLVGDFLYSRSFQMMVELDRMRVMRILADTTNLIAEGEVLQLLNIGNPDTDESRLSQGDRAQDRGAVRRSHAARCRTRRACRRNRKKRSREYGLDLGFAFQIADDVLDYVIRCRHARQEHRR